MYGRIPVDYAPVQDLSIDIKTMPQAFGGYHLLLLITCHWQIQGGHCQHVLPPKQDPILSFSHMFLLRSAHI